MGFSSVVKHSTGIIFDMACDNLLAFRENVMNFYYYYCAAANGHRFIDLQKIAPIWTTLSIFFTVMEQHKSCGYLQ